MVRLLRVDIFSSVHGKYGMIGKALYGETLTKRHKPTIMFVFIACDSNKINKELVCLHC
ncbi:hypothetical protein Leryth_025994 [Lithospermum erythrorhizon]|nr:hypothetical protein Leryth_025994 [Lithospermum erythrorhizon]